MKLHAQFSAAGCNRAPQCLAWARDGLLAYAADKAVRIYDPKRCEIVASLLGHSGEVRCLVWAPPEAPTFDQLLLTAACDGCVRAWRASYGSWTCIGILQVQGSAMPISSLACHYLAGENTLLILACSAAASVACWTVALGGDLARAWGDGAKRTSLHDGMPMAHSVALVDGGTGGWTLVALGGVDCRVYIYTRAPGHSTFALAARLEGHTDWIRGLAWVGSGNSGTTKLRLASAGQDKYIRVWSFVPEGASETSHTSGFEAAITRFAPKPRIQLGQATTLVATLETLLVGHEDWVMSVAWKPSCSNDEQEVPCLLSASMDRSMMLWEPDGTGLWLSRTALGDAGANHLGYYTCCWSPEGDAVATHGYTGSLHVWRRALDEDSSGAGTTWLPVAAPSGHTAKVVDLAWTADDCLLSVSDDQTARCWARCSEAATDDGGVEYRWREVARPQVHGHNFYGVAVVPDSGCHLPVGAEGRNGYSSSSSSTTTYASCSEEKVIRVFSAPQAFLRSLDAFQSRSINGSAEAGVTEALGATLPALGLSNKAVYKDDGVNSSAADTTSAGFGKEAYAEGPDLAPAAAPRVLHAAPLEETLAQSTLWPEVRKLYGHGNEVVCLAGDPQGRFLASASFSSGTDAATAAIWFWDRTRNWAPAGKCEAHTLTVTRLAFSPDGNYLASVARDRTLAVWRRRRENVDDEPPFELVARVKAASRVVYDVSWSENAQVLVTGARDGSVTLWKLLEEREDGQATLAPWRDLEKQASAVRSVAIAPSVSNALMYTLAIGLESGEITLVSCPESDQDDPTLSAFSVSTIGQHAGPVRRLAWHRTRMNQLLLASCSDDHSVQIWSEQ